MSVKLKPRWQQIRDKPDLVLVEDLLAALWIETTANTGGPPQDGAVLQSSSQSFVWSAFDAYVAFEDDLLILTEDGQVEITE
jgi:hypothetical protein